MNLGTARNSHTTATHGRLASVCHCRHGDLEGSYTNHNDLQMHKNKNQNYLHSLNYHDGVSIHFPSEINIMANRNVQHLVSVFNPEALYPIAIVPVQDMKLLLLTIKSSVSSIASKRSVWAPIDFDLKKVDRL
jgi:hypothetical protein